MAQVTFTFGNGLLEVTDGGGLFQYESADFRARANWNHTRLRIVLYPINQALTPNNRREWETDDVANYILNGETYANTAEFISVFNALAGSNIGYNTKYPELLFSQHIELDTSVDQQVVPVWCINVHAGGYVIITAPDGNTGNIFVGEEDVSNESYYLEAGKSITLEISDLSLIWVQSDTPGDTVDVIGVAKI